MSVMDIIAEFSDNQSLASLDDSSTVSTDVINLGDADLLYGAGQPIYLCVKIGTACAGGTSVQFQLYAHTSTSVNSGTAVHDSGAVSVSTLVAGYEVMRVPLDVNVDDAGQYIGMYYTAVGTMSAGTVDAYLALSATSSLPITTQVRSSNI
jgi:hypothetical protein